MASILLAILAAISNRAVCQSCILGGTEDYIVRPGQNASFYCVTNTSRTFWIINKEYYSLQMYYDRPHPPFTLSKSTIGNKTHLEARIQTDRSSNEGDVICVCTNPHHTRYNITAHWRTSTCLAVVEEDVTTSASLSYMVIGSNILVGMVELQLPIDCYQGTMYYSIVVEDVRTHSNTTIEGQEDYYQNQTVSITTGRLKVNRIYEILVKARIIQAEDWRILNRLMLNTSGNTAPSLRLCNDHHSTTSNVSTIAVISTTTYTPSINSLSSGLPSSGTLMISVVVLGVVVQLLIIVVIGAVCGLILRRKCKRIRRKTRTMVTNPIYDGPMYESIHPQFRVISRQNAAANVDDQTSIKEEEGDTSSAQERELSVSEIEMACSDPPTSPRYVSHPKPHPSQQSIPPQEIVEVSLSSMVSLSEPAPAQSQTRDRNVLGLTLDLGGGGNPTATARDQDYEILAINNGRQTRRRATSATQSRPLLHSYFSSASSTPGEDDNYTVMSPVTHVPTVTTDGTSFLRQQHRAYRDRCTTLI